MRSGHRYSNRKFRNRPRPSGCETRPKRRRITNAIMAAEEEAVRLQWVRMGKVEAMKISEAMSKVCAAIERFVEDKEAPERRPSPDDSMANYTEPVFELRRAFDDLAKVLERKVKR